MVSVPIAAFVFGLITDSEDAAFVLQGVVLCMLDPFVWLFTMPLAIKIRDDAPFILALQLLFIGFVLAKAMLGGLPEPWGQADGWRLVGTLIGVLLVGYASKSIAILVGKVG